MKRRIFLFFALFFLGALPTFAQVSNDNEDGVNKVDAHHGGSYDFVPGHVLVKFKDESSIEVQRTARGQYRAASISKVDQLLRNYGVKDMEKLFPAEVAKPKSHLCRKKAPNGTMVQEKNLDKVFWVKTNIQRQDSTLQLIEQLKALPEVEYAEPNYKVYITADVPSGFGATSNAQTQSVHRVPVAVETTASVICSNPSSNPLYFRQYGITQQKIQKLWNKPIINNRRPVIAILDTGVDITHPDLVDNIWTNTQEAEGERAYDDDHNGKVDDVHGWNFVDNYYETPDRNGHGTHVAGIAAAADNNIGIVGANPLALIMPIKVMNDRGEGDQATIARGIDYAAQNGADIINMSLGGPLLSSYMKEAIDNAYQTAIIVASAGNNGKDIYNMHNPPGTNYPAAYYLVLGVEASGSNLQRASFSNYDPDGPFYSEDGINGRNYEMQVPGDKIYSTLPEGKYNQLSGTSMSAPLLAGAISALQMVKDYPSKDVLFGDLIHLKANFEDIYSDDTPRTPKIDLISLTVDDNVEGNTNIDGQVDVGETIKFTPVLRNTWANATDINLRLSVDNAYQDFVTIQNAEVPFGYSISAYGHETAKTPIVVVFGDNISDNTRIRFTLEVSYAESTESFTQDVYVTVNNMVKISGLVSEDRTLTANHVYHVIDNIGIMNGATLTIEPGTRLEFSEGTSLVSYGKLVANGTPEKHIVFTGYNSEVWSGIKSNASPRDTISYCFLDNLHQGGRPNTPYMKDCVIIPETTYLLFAQYEGNLNGERITIQSDIYLQGDCISQKIVNSNIINCNIPGPNPGSLYLPSYTQLTNCNYFNNYGTIRESGKYYGKQYALGGGASTPTIIHSDNPSYLGTSDEAIIRPYIAEMGNANTFVQLDLSNMPTRPYEEAHGIVWKVVVNGYDAQDQYEQLPPLGVAKHKFEVYFNRPMNKAVAPKISFGVREPYMQHAVDEEGEGAGWNEDGTIYTAYKTITGKTMSDGVNRIYVRGAEDDEFFEIPYEKTRFNINIQAAGSMATGFAAEAGLGRVNLTWNNENNDFEDAMGFNVYRFTSPDPSKGGEGVVDTVCINKEIVDIETTEYTDYDVVPGQTYYYMYKVLSTDLQEYDVSNVVAVTPLTSELGDANGSGDVDVADVITTVNYAAGMEPKPFIFEAADMNTDLQIDILDVIGIIQKIINPNAGARVMAEPTATYTIEDGVLYVESPVELAGMQAQLSLTPSPSPKGEGSFKVAADLDGFEHTSAWLTDEDYLFLAYNMNGKTLTAGKHALLYIGDGELTSLRLSDTMGHNVTAVAGEGVTKIDSMGSKVMTQKGVYNLNGQKVSVNDANLRKGVYIINGQKVIK